MRKGQRNGEEGFSQVAIYHSHGYFFFLLSELICMVVANVLLRYLFACCVLLHDRFKHIFCRINFRKLVIFIPANGITTLR